MRLHRIFSLVRVPQAATSGVEGRKGRRETKESEFARGGKRWGAWKTRIRENSAASMQYIW